MTWRLQDKVKIETTIIMTDRKRKITYWSYWRVYNLLNRGTDIPTASWTNLQPYRKNDRQRLPNSKVNLIQQELSYRKQIARQLRTQYVEGIYRPNNRVTLKSRAPEAIWQVWRSPYQS